MSQKLLLLIGLVPFSEECLVRLAGATTRVRPRAVAVVVCAVLSLAVLGVAAVAGRAHAPLRRRRRPHLWPAACAVPESDLRAQRQEDDADTEQLHRHDLVAELDKGVEDGEQLAHRLDGCEDQRAVRLDGVKDEELTDGGADGHEENVRQYGGVLADEARHVRELPSEAEAEGGEGGREEVRVHHHRDGADRVLLEDTRLVV
mmetsp:Transcript_12628/g.39889  ORF Transcript_12628/g.39889 Transcript_12628/m.39889 type:complete len:203 (+) Transcript_12628:89-697(+)